jgi:hypothetical protein
MNANWSLLIPLEKLCRGRECSELCLRVGPLDVPWEVEEKTVMGPNDFFKEQLEIYSRLIRISLEPNTLILKPLSSASISSHLFLS